MRQQSQIRYLAEIISASWSQRRCLEWHLCPWCHRRQKKKGKCVWSATHCNTATQYHTRNTLQHTAMPSVLVTSEKSETEYPGNEHWPEPPSFQKFVWLLFWQSSCKSISFKVPVIRLSNFSLCATSAFRSAILGLSIYHTAKYCNTLQHTATHCNTLQHTATHCNILQHTATNCNTLQHTATYCNTPHYTASHCNTLQDTATLCNTPQYTVLGSSTWTCSSEKYLHALCENWLFNVFKSDRI